MSDIEAFCRQLVQCPDDDTTLLVFADFLQEHGMASLATTLRAAINLRRDNKVYAVSSGEYLDYGINAIFSSEKNAQRFIDGHPDNDRPDFNGIETYTLDIGIGPLDKGLKPWFVEFLMEMSGDIRMTEVRPSSPNIEDHTVGVLQTFFTKDGKRFWVDVWAETEQHAVKIANEKRVVRLVEEQQGLHQGAK